MPRDGSATRSRILAAAEHLVIENGFAATSVDAVIAASATSKGAFFHHFDSKNDLARALVQRYAEGDLAQLQDALRQTASVDDPASRVLAFVQVFIDTADELMSEQSSCLYVAAVTERQLAGSSTTEPIRGAIASWRRALTDLLRPALDLAGAQTVDVDALADHLFVTFEGAFILCRATGQASHMRRQLQTVHELYAALLDR